MNERTGNPSFFDLQAPAVLYFAGTTYPILQPLIKKMPMAVTCDLQMRLMYTQTLNTNTKTPTP